MLRRSPFPLALQIFFGAETQISLVLGKQSLCVLAINRQPVGLPIWPKLPADIRPFIPIEPKPLQICDQLAFKACLAAVHVGVFDAEHHRSALLPRKQPVEQSGARIADVKMSSRGGSKTHANFGILSHATMLAEGASHQTDRLFVLRATEI